MYPFASQNTIQGASSDVILAIKGQLWQANRRNYYLEIWSCDFKDERSRPVLQRAASFEFSKHSFLEFWVEAVKARV